MDLEPIFGMRISVLSEVFWEDVKHFIDNWGHIFTSFMEYLMTERSKTYVESVIVEEAFFVALCVV